jgi:hypothetical protein
MVVMVMCEKFSSKFYQHTSTMDTHYGVKIITYYIQSQMIETCKKTMIKMVWGC